jgi:hypothetical protein
MVKKHKKRQPERLPFFMLFEKQLILRRDNVQSDFVFHFFVKVDQC